MTTPPIPPSTSSRRGDLHARPASATPWLMTKSRLGPGTTINANAATANASSEPVGTTAGEDTGVV